MKFLTAITSILFYTFCHAQLPNNVIRNLNTGKIIDNITHVYWLPYKTGNRYLFVQGANSSFNHKNELAYDFKMMKGSTICAARGGVVVAVKKNSDSGGLKNENLSNGNHIIK